VGKQTRDEVVEAAKEEDMLIDRVKMIILALVLAAVFLPLDMATLAIAGVGLYLFMNPVRRLLGWNVA